MSQPIDGHAGLSAAQEELLQRVIRGEVRLSTPGTASSASPTAPVAVAVAEPAASAAPEVAPRTLAEPSTTPPPATGGDYLIADAPLAPVAPLAAPADEPASTVLPQVSAGRLGVQVVQEGTGLPFFYQHGDWNGNAFYCHPLAKSLGVERPFYLLDPYRLEDLPAPPPLEQVAADYVALIKQVRPTGPYLLGGFCNGALIIYEVARQLVAAGDAVPLLVLIDPWSPLYRQGAVRLVHRLGRLVGARRRGELTSFLHMRHIYQLLNPNRQQRREDRTYLRDQDRRLLRLWPSSATLRKDYVGAFSWMSAQYHPDYYPGRIAIFWNREDPFYRLLWHKTIVDRDREVSEDFTDGNHLSMRTDYVEALGAQVRRAIDSLAL